VNLIAILEQEEIARLTGGNAVTEFAPGDTVVVSVNVVEAVERTFQLYSPQIAGIEVKRRGDVRRAKLYYLRSRSGKSARIKEKLVLKKAKSA